MHRLTCGIQGVNVSEGLQGLQNWSVGDTYPYTVEGVGNGAVTEWRVFNTVTNQRGKMHRTQQEAVMDMHSIRLRNMMHG